MQQCMYVNLCVRETERKRVRGGNGRGSMCRYAGMRVVGGGRRFDH